MTCVMMRLLSRCGLLLVVFTMMGAVALANEDNHSSSKVGFSPEIVADYIHAVIAADRALYTTHVVERMNQEKVVIAAEMWKQRKALPLPAQMLQMSGQMVKMSGLGLRYRLASLWPIYEENGPASVFEEAGLKVVADDPTQVYSGTIKRGNKKFFKAIYADIAVSKECVTCHNGHILSSKHDYKVGDVMGGLIISFPLPLEEHE